MRTAIQYVATLCLLGLSGAFVASSADEPAAEKKGVAAKDFDPKALGDEMAALWGERLCAAEPGVKYEEQVISLACNAEYTAAERDKMLDLFFRKGFLFRGESYDVKGTTGHYWYRFEHQQRMVYVRLHMTSQGVQWGSAKMPARVAVYVDNLTSADELTAWQTLGIPLTYGLGPGDEAAVLAQRIDEYKQEVWLALDLRPEAFSEPGQSAAASDVIGQNLLPEHVKSSLEKTGDVWGVVVRDLNSLTTTVAGARAIFAAIKAEGKTYVLLPARYNRALSTTANIMGMNAHRVTHDLAGMCARSPSRIWNHIREKAGSGQVIVRFPANAKRCANTLSRTLRRDAKTEFRTLSTFFGYADDAPFMNKAAAAP